MTLRWVVGLALVSVLSVGFASAAPGAFRGRSDPNRPLVLGVVNAAWSPDGRRLAFTRDGGQEGLRIWTLDLAPGGRPKPVTAPGWSSYPSWSPGGTELAYEATLGHSTTPVVVTVAADGSGRALIVNSASQPSWSPDGKRLASVSANLLGPEWLLVTTLKGPVTKRVAVPRGLNPVSPIWSSSGTQLAFRSDTPGGAFYTVDTRTGRMRQLAPTAATTAAMSPDWRLIAYAASGDKTLTVASLSGRAPQRLTTMRGKITSIAWSHDEQRLAFTAALTDGSHASLYVIDRTGQHLRKLVTG